MEVTELKEHEDGSATYRFDMTAEEHEAMCRNGITWAIICGVTGLTMERALQDYANTGDVDETGTDPTSTE